MPTEQQQQQQLQEWPTEASSYQLIGKIGQGAFATVWKAQKLISTTLIPAPTNTEYGTSISSTVAPAAAAAIENERQQPESLNAQLVEQGKGGIDDPTSTSSILNYCAVKILNLDHVDTNLSEIRLEVQAMRLLSHANVLTMFTAFVVDRHLWLVTPLLRKGSSLHCLQTARRALFHQQRATGEPYTLANYPTMEPHILYILHETLLGLQYIHENGQIHRDIKAGNILLDDTGDVKIADFGVSGWLVQGGARQEKAKTFVGTPCWMAPEVMEQIHGYDYKADLWSLGITALELARGYAPYAKYPPMKVLILTIQEDPPGLDSYDTEEDMLDDCDDIGIQFAALEPYTKHIFEAFVKQCLQKNPSKRPNCQEILSNNEYFAQYTSDPNFRQTQRNYLHSQVCALVPDVGNIRSDTHQQLHHHHHQQQQQHSNQQPIAPVNNSSKMPGNLPISVILSTTSDDRPAGTTWVFADGSSQVLSSSSAHSSSRLAEVDDVLAELDEFGKQTGGEHYGGGTTTTITTASSSSNEHNYTNNDRTIRSGNNASGGGSPQHHYEQQQQQQLQYQQHQIYSSAPPVFDQQQQQLLQQENTVRSNNFQPPIVNVPPPHFRLHQQHVDDDNDDNNVDVSTNSFDDIDQFMNEFEQTTGGEDFRRSSQTTTPQEQDEATRENNHNTTNNNNNPSI